MSIEYLLVPYVPGCIWEAIGLPSRGDERGLRSYRPIAVGGLV